MCCSKRNTLDLVFFPQHGWSLMSWAHYPRWAAPAPAPCQIDTIYGRMLIGTTRLFVNGAFCINQLTVGRGQQKLRKAMEISSKTSSKGRKSWMWKLMVKPGALWDVLERAREIICILTIHSQIQNVYFCKIMFIIQSILFFLLLLKIEDGRLLGGDVKSIKCQMLSRRNVTSLSATGHTTIKHQTPDRP